MLQIINNKHVIYIVIELKDHSTINSKWGFYS